MLYSKYMHTIFEKGQVYAVGEFLLWTRFKFCQQTITLEDKDWQSLQQMSSASSAL